MLRVNTISRSIAKLAPSSVSCLDLEEIAEIYWAIAVVKLKCSGPELTWDLDHGLEAQKKLSKDPDYLYVYLDTNSLVSGRKCWGQNDWL
jgi:hypothetical protein